MLKVMSAVQARVHYAFKHELKLLSAIIRDYTDDDYDYDPASGPRVAKRADYDMVEIIPVSDPNAATMSQRVVQYQAVIQLAQMAPQVYDIPALHRQMLEVLGIRNAAKLVPMEDDQTPKDPITENMNALKLKPMKAFMYQDHAAHIQTHMNMMNDPAVAALIGQNPQASLIVGALQAHIAEHLGYQYQPSGARCYRYTAARTRGENPRGHGGADFQDGGRRFSDCSGPKPTSQGAAASAAERTRPDHDGGDAETADPTG
jgi:hypothetical protein